MQINGDFFRWLAFAVRVIRLLIEMFGDEHEQEESKNNKIEV